jgi:hypothetical protein
MALGAFVSVWTDTQAFEPSVNYMLQCMGCHTPDGRGEPGHVPSIRNTLVPFANTADGRKFLVQVPGSAQSKLSDAELADVLNWMIDNLSAIPRPPRERGSWPLNQPPSHRSNQRLSDSRRSAARR